jgi:hypothetical protein
MMALSKRTELREGASEPEGERWKERHMDKGPERELTPWQGVALLGLLLRIVGLVVIGLGFLVVNIMEVARPDPPLNAVLWIFNTGSVCVMVGLTGVGLFFHMNGKPHWSSRSSIAAR